MRKVILGTLLAASMATSAYAQTELRVSSTFGPNHVNAAAYAVFLDKLKTLTNGEYTGRDFPSGLVSPAEIVSGLQSGLVDIGTVIMPYFPAEFVEANLPAEAALMGNDALAVAAASAEYIVNCKRCLAEFAQVGQVYLSGSSTSAYQLLSVVPIREVEDLKGVRIRTGGSAFTRWAEAMGAVPVQLPATEIFEAMSQGVVQVHYNAPQDLKSYNLFDVVKDVSLINLGTFNGVSPFSMRLDLWQSLSSDQRSQFIRAAQYGSAAILFRYEEESKKALEKARADGIEIIEPSNSLTDANNEFLKSDLAALPEILTEKGVESAGGKIQNFQQLIDKWRELVKGVDSQEAYVDLLMQEIWDKVDLTNYPG